MPTNPKPKSSKKSATARANGAKSHGPATPEGRARSSQNALRHGLATRAAALPPMSIVLGDESTADFQRLLNSYLDEFAPTSPIEVELVETMASARWRLRRLANIETTLLANEILTSVDDVDRFFDDVDCIPEPHDRLACAFKSLAEGASLHLLNRYEGTINRSYAQAFKQLHLLRSLRIRVQPNEPKQSLRMEPSGAPKSLPVKSLPVEPSATGSGDRARPPVLQTPPTRSLPVEPQATGQPHKIHSEPHQIPAPALQIPAEFTREAIGDRAQRATMEVSPRINDQHLHS